MSYEHCEEHDMDATNGCERCFDERLDDAKRELRQSATDWCWNRPNAEDKLYRAAESYAEALRR
jgi:hypothetical protein